MLLWLASCHHFVLHVLGVRWELASVAAHSAFIEGDCANPPVSPLVALVSEPLNFRLH